MAYEQIVRFYFPTSKRKDSKGNEVEVSQRGQAFQDLTAGIQFTNIMFTLHTICRQKAIGRIQTNVQQKSTSTDFTEPIWTKAVNDAGLENKKFEETDENNWYGTMGPYLDFFAGFGLRMKELHVGHSKMPLTKREGSLVEFPVAKYGINGAHHILLQGCTFPPEKRSSMAQSVGPMTAFLCMVKSDGIYRKKWASAVKRAQQIGLLNFKFLQHGLQEDILESIKQIKRNFSMDSASCMTRGAIEIRLDKTRRNYEYVRQKISSFSLNLEAERSHDSYPPAPSKSTPETTPQVQKSKLKLMNTNPNNLKIKFDLLEMCIRFNQRFFTGEIRSFAIWWTNGMTTSSGLTCKEKSREN
ncbi:Uncharacterized protein OBRU01_23417, partial [Operophtera brumata]